VKYLSTCNGAVLCDTSARVDLVQAVLDNYKVGTIPLVLLCWESGTSDTRKNLSRKIAELCNPTLITGRLGDIHALGLDIMSRVAGIIDSTDDKDETDSYSSLKPVTPVPVEKSVGASPRFKRKKDVEKGHKRQRTAIPHMIMKGHFRHESMKDVQIPEAHTSARKLAAQLGTYVHIYETNMITCGEFFVEINNTHIGMENVHSTVHCCAAIIASVIGCAEIRKKETLSLLECAHGLSLYYVAAEEATCEVSTKHEVMLPGSLRTTLIDYLFLLDEKTVRTNANIVQHNSLP
jgi:hydroxyethylthiazole kinase-like sugar kinase family protein